MLHAYHGRILNTHPALLHHRLPEVAVVPLIAADRSADAAGRRHAVEQVTRGALQGELIVVEFEVHVDLSSKAFGPVPAYGVSSWSAGLALGGGGSRSRPGRGV